MWLSTHYFSGFLQDWFHVFLYEIKKNSVWYNFYQGTSVSITFYIFEHYQLWMMDSKGQRVFFPKTPQLCVWHTEVRRCYHFKLVSHFQLWFPIWGVLVNRLSKISVNSLKHFKDLKFSRSSVDHSQQGELTCFHGCLGWIHGYKEPAVQKESTSSTTSIFSGATDNCLNWMASTQTNLVQEC